MEKSGTRIRRSWRTGLLVCLGFVWLSFRFDGMVFAAPLTRAYIQELRFHKEDEYFFTASDCRFSIDIESVSPTELSVYLNTIPNGVELVSIQKEAYVPPANAIDKVFGTHIVVTVRFTKMGTYKLFDADVRFQGALYQLAFEPVQVYENIQIVKPELSVRFADDALSSVVAVHAPLSVSAGQHVVFTLFIRYAAGIEAVTWNLPENSLFTELKRFEITDPERYKRDFSPSECPVITFDWQPLLPGTYVLPEVEVLALSYGGARVNIEVPPLTLRVTKAEADVGTAAVPTAGFEEAFAAPSVDVRQEVDPQMSFAVDVEALATLHVRERHALPFVAGPTKARQDAERDAGLLPGHAAPRLSFLTMGLVFSVLFCMLTVACFFLKKFPVCVAGLFAMLLCVLLTFVYAIRLQTPYAVFRGGEVLPIPEKDISKGFFLQAGSLVRIAEDAGSWMYIVCGDSYGWVSTDAVILIR